MSCCQSLVKVCGQALLIFFDLAFYSKMSSEAIVWTGQRKGKLHYSCRQLDDDDFGSGPNFFNEAVPFDKGCETGVQGRLAESCGSIAWKEAGTNPRLKAWIEQLHRHHRARL